MDQNKSSASEEIENGELCLQGLRSLVNAFVNMPSDVLNQLPGYTMDIHNKIKLMNAKLKSLQENNIDNIETPELNHIENGQSSNEMIMTTTDIPNNGGSNDKTIRVRDNNDIPTNYPPNNDVNNQNRDFDDLADSMLLEEFNNNNDIDLPNNDVSNDTATIQGDNNDLAAESGKKIEICNDPNKECVPRNFDSEQEEGVIEIDSDSDECSGAADSNDKMEIKSEPANICDNNDEAISTSDGARDSPLPTFDDDDDDEQWNQYVHQLKLHEDYLNEDETGITEQTKYSPGAHKAQVTTLETEETRKLSHSTTDTISNTLLRDNDDLPPCDLAEEAREVAEVPVHPKSPLAPSTGLETEETRTLSKSTTDTISNTLLPDNNAAPPCDLPLTSPMDVSTVEGTSKSDTQSTFALHVLKQVFKLEQFKEGQEKVIRDVVINNNNCLIIMPAGSGKSLCYQLPVVWSDGVTIVICQTESLIRDQVEMLKPFGIRVEHLVIRTKKIKDTVNNNIYLELMSDGQKIKLLYIVPEKLQNSNCMSVLVSLYDRKKISRFVIDDAQYIPAWFGLRKAYRELGENLRNFPGVPLTVLSSGISPSVRADIIDKLEMHDFKEHRISLDVPNFSYNVMEKTNRTFEKVADMISDKYSSKSCIVYCLSVKDTHKMASILNERGVRAETYHTKMEASFRKKVYNEWHSDSHFVICATSVFMMGKVKAGVKLVVHLGLPESLEAYCQQVGRAGRGEVVRCELHFTPHDLKAHKKKLENSILGGIDDKEKQLIYMLSFCENQVKCRRLQILEYFNDLEKVECRGSQALCDNCLNNMKYAQQLRYYF